MNSRSLSAITFTLVAFYASSCAASASSGTIDPTAFRGKVCHSADCIAPEPGTINFRPTGTTAVTIDDVAGLDGVAWGNELGWITFDPTGAEQVTINPTTGALSGKGWSQVSGWINFQPTGYGVSITSQGEFTGWAWAGGPYGGWIKFDCSSQSSCVRTDWRPIVARSGPTPTPDSGDNGPIAGSGAGWASPNDLCWNIDAVQVAVPDGYARLGQTCTPILPDMCQNVPGVQSTLPPNYVADDGGLCRLRVDHCPKYPDVQIAVPPGYGVAADGSCVPAHVLPASSDESRTAVNARGQGQTVDPPTRSEYLQTPLDHDATQVDQCPNISGIQTTVPVGYTADARGSCIPQTTDYCLNLPGLQREVPEDLIISDDGSCAPQRVVTAAPSPQPSSIEPPRTSPDSTGSTIPGAVALAGAAVAASGLGWLVFLLFWHRWGRVFDIETGRSLEGVRLLLYRDDGMLIAETIADRRGRYGFHVRPGSYQLRAVRSNYSLETTTEKTTYDGGTIRVNWAGSTSLDVAMRQTFQQPGNVETNL